MRDGVHTSVANVFNERGHGLAVKGREAVISKEDRQPHLSATDAASLIGDCLKAYRTEHRTMPARVVIHKSSSYSDDEKRGFLEGLEEGAIELIDLISLRKGSTRLFREGYYPPPRGTWLQFDQASHVIYTRGSVDFYQEYPGMYIPRTLETQTAELSTSPVEIMEELLVLSKTNWNNVQMDSTMPIPIRDRSTPTDIPAFLALLDRLSDLLRRPTAVVAIHCAAGVGRTGTVAACLLVRSGMAARDAVTVIEAAGSGPETPRQLAFIRGIESLAGD